MFGTLSIPESVEYLYTTFVRNYRGCYSQDQFTYREDPTRAIERSMINFANLALKAVRILARAAAARPGARAPAPAPTCSTSSRRCWSGDRAAITPDVKRHASSEWRLAVDSMSVHAPTRSASTSAPTRCAPSSSTARTAATVGTSVFDYPSGDQGVLLHPKRSAPGAAESGRLHRRAAGTRSPARSPRRDATPGFSRDRVIGIGVDTTGSTPLPVDAQARPLALDPQWKSNLAAHAWLWKDHTVGRRGGARSPRPRAQHAPEYLAPIGGTYSSEWWWSKIWHCLKVAPDVFDAAASWVELADFVPAVLAGVDDPARDRPLRLRRRAQGDVLGRVGRPAVEGVPRAARSEARRAARSALRQGACRRARPAGHAVRASGRRRSGCAPGIADRDGRLRRALRRRRLRHRDRHARQDHRHVHLRLRDRAGRPTASPTSPASAASSTARSCRATSASRRGSRPSATS